MAAKPDPNFDPDFASPAQWAAIYRAYGLQIVPGWMPGEPKSGSSKRPFLSKWTEFQEQLVADAVFARWYDTQAGDYRDRINMGLITGRCSDNCLIIDLDTQKTTAAQTWWSGVLAVHNNGMEVETPRQRTGGGGQQILFRAPTGWNAPTNKTSIGVDFRGQGGFAVLPPSLHDSGNYYEWLPGCAPWEIPIMDAPAWLLEEITKLVGAHGGNPGAGAQFGQNDRTPPPGGEFDEFGNRTDMREDKMFRMVWRVILNLRRKNPIRPTSAEEQRIMEAEYGVYERANGPKETRPGETRMQALEREERGPTEWSKKWRRAMSQWDTDVKAAAAEPDPSPEQPDLASEFDQASDKAKKAGDFYEYLTVEQILALPPPKWMIEKLVIENSLGFIYGPPGSLKTFMAIDIALALATKQPSWWGYSIQHTGTVVYILAEGVLNLPNRILAWQQHRGVDIRKAPFILIRQSINFLQTADVGKLRATVQDIHDKIGGPIAAVFVDTVSRMLPGAKENQQEDMTIFVAACSVVQRDFGATVFGLHHTNYAGGFRGSTVIPAAGDFLIETRREAGAMTGSIFAKKVKDGEDGWERDFIVTKVAVGSLGASSSLVLDGAEKQPPSSDGLPIKDICRQILAAIDEQWTKGKPWCHAKNSPRCAETNISRRWNIDRKIVARLLEYWNANDIIEEEVLDAKKRVKGYRKLVNI